MLKYTPQWSDRQEFYAAFIHCPFLVKLSSYITLSLFLSFSSQRQSIFSLFSIIREPHFTTLLNIILLFSLISSLPFPHTKEVTTFQLQSLSLISSSVTKSERF
ncbi:unnamed protein product [Lathyrus sativus]|nr:unnamed protein product [Lathyrus sativus]